MRIVETCDGHFINLYMIHIIEGSENHIYLADGDYFQLMKCPETFHNKDSVEIPFTREHLLLWYRMVCIVLCEPGDGFISYEHLHERSWAMFINKLNRDEKKCVSHCC